MKYIIKMSFFSVLFSSFFVYGAEVEESALFQKDFRIVRVPVAGIYSAPNEQNSYQSQIVHGHHIEVISQTDDNWVKVKSNDEITGYMKTNDLIQKNISPNEGFIFSDDLTWRANKDLWRININTALIYTKPSIKAQSFVSLPYNSYIKRVINQDVENTDSDAAQFVPVELADGTIGWIISSNIEPIEPLELKEIINRIEKFEGIPYISGGSSTQGFDSFGLTTLIAQQLGYSIPRNTISQAEEKQLIKVAYDDIKPGDLVYFGKNEPTHAAFCIANRQIMHAAVLPRKNKNGTTVYEKGVMKTFINYIALPQFIGACRLPSLKYNPAVYHINEKIFSYINGKSWHPNNPVPLFHLRVVNVNYWGFDRCVHTGPIIVHQEVAYDLVDIFRDLFFARYLIEKIELIEKYNAVDGYSCADNNSSGFCSRKFTGGSLWSLHSFGLAVDLNTRLNPYVCYNFDKQGNDYVGPVQGKEFVDRTLPVLGLIKKNDPCYNAFITRGWKWAGEWREKLGYPYDDYQHFYKDDGLSPELTALAQANEPRPEKILPMYSNINRSIDT